MKRIVSLLLITTVALAGCGINEDDFEGSSTEKKTEQTKDPKDSASVTDTDSEDKDAQTDIDSQDKTSAIKGNNDSPENVALLWFEGIANTDEILICQALTEEDKQILAVNSGKQTCEEAVADKENGFFDEIGQQESAMMKSMLPLVKTEIKEGPTAGKATVAIMLGSDDPETNIMVGVIEDNGKWYIDPEGL